MRYEHVLVWLRRDLRLEDHTALAQASQWAQRVSVAFVFDRDILAALPADDRRVAFIWGCVAALKTQLQARGGDLWVLHGTAVTEITALAQQLAVSAVLTHADYEPSARIRDAAVAEALMTVGIAWHAFDDQVIFPPTAVLSQQARPLTVFSAYQKAWLRQLTPAHYAPRMRVRENFAPGGNALPSLTQLGFPLADPAQLRLPLGVDGAAQQWEDFQARLPFYHQRRDFPAQKGVSYLSTHLRFGTVSVRPLVAAALAQGGDGGKAWLNELIWREFFMAIVWHFPQVEQAFQPQYRQMTFLNRRDWFEAWCVGQTGYPLVDAAMRQLRQSGWMHNRLRMVVASFLVKDLLIDWRWGEQWFAQQLLDFDLSANNGNWQWAASTGCDAQPYFRIFNPRLQSEKFDPDGVFIRRYVPELASCPNRWIHAPAQMPASERAQIGLRLGIDYPEPLVDHALQRQVALSLFKTANAAKDSGMLNAV